MIAHAGLVAPQRPAQLRASVEANLASLGVEQLAVVNLRRLDAPPGIRADGNQRIDLEIGKPIAKCLDVARVQCLPPIPRLRRTRCRARSRSG
jgi:hypothetical protein